ncbi:MAG: TetR/AcrR family transcriptional regulator [Thermodesulfobacteriota bacterium]
MMLTLSEFKNLVNLSKQEICREIFSENADRIKVKKEERVVKNLAKIFDATLAISNKKGFHAMSLRDLSESSGLSMGALYSYFSSKDELLSMIQEQGRRLTYRVLGEQILGVTDPREMLSVGIITHLYLSEVMQPWFYFTFMEAKNLDRKELKEAIASELWTEKFFADILRQGAEKGVFMARDPEMTSAVLKALLQEWYVKRWKYRNRNVSVETYARFIIDWMMAFLAPEGK